MIIFMNSIKYGNTCISLPTYPRLKNKEVDFITKKINSLFDKAMKKIFTCWRLWFYWS